MSNAFNNFGKASPAVFNNSGRPIAAMPGLGLGHDLAAAATAGKQNPNPAAKLKTPTSVPATAGGIQAAQNTKAAELLAMLTKNAQGGAPVPGPAGIPPAPNSAAVVQPPPPGPIPPPAAAPSPIPANPRQQPPRERTPEDDRQAAVLNGILSEGQEARQIPDRSPTRELESDLMTRGKLANDSISAFNKFAQLYKKSRQDNSKPSRSAMGESNGLSYEHRKEDHATGTDAWSSLDRFRRKESGDQSFSAAFVDECVSRGMSVDQIADAIVKVGHDFGEDVAATLIGDLEKQAINWSALGKIFNWGSKAAPAAAKVTSVVPEATQAAKAVSSTAQPTKTILKNNFKAKSNNPAASSVPPVQTPVQAANTTSQAAQAANTTSQAAQAAANPSFYQNLSNFSQAVTNPLLSGIGGASLGAYGAGDEATTAERVRGAIAGGLGFGGLSALKNRFVNKPIIGNLLKIFAGVPAGATVGGAAGATADTFMKEFGEDNPLPKNYYRDLGRVLGGTTGSVPGVLAKAITAPTVMGVQSATGQSYIKPVLDAGRNYAQSTKKNLLGGMPSDVFSVDENGNYSIDTNKIIDKYVQDKFGNIDQYVQQYTNPLFQAMGMDVSKMPAWQRYAMLGGGLMTGAGALMQNPYMMGFGGLLGAGAGMYPTLAGMANPYVRKQFGFDLPGANPYYSSSAPQPPASPPQ